MFNINAKLIYMAMDFYQDLGYELISVPYIVDKDIVDFTIPNDRNAHNHGNFGYYVGSAEQSIYQIIRNGGDLPKKCLAITPCCRDESILDESHQEVFLKIELISFDLGYSHISIMNDVLKFIHYNGLDNGHELTTVIQDDNMSYDINMNGVEIGSYGYRWFDDILVSYGTGLALPRFEYSLSVSGD